VSAAGVGGGGWGEGLGDGPCRLESSLPAATRCTAATTELTPPWPLLSSFGVPACPCPPAEDEEMGVQIELTQEEMEAIDRWARLGQGW
jgi:hypothetical protein